MKGYSPDIETSTLNSMKIELGMKIVERGESEDEREGTVKDEDS